MQPRPEEQRNRGQAGELRLTNRGGDTLGSIVGGWDGSCSNVMLKSPMETSLFLAYRKTPSSEKKGLQTNSTGTCPFSGKDWDHPKQTPSSAHSGIGSEMPTCRKSGCKCCRKLTKAGLEIPKETKVQAPRVSQRDEDPIIALATNKAP